jgi:hypothetical protein
MDEQLKCPLDSGATADADKPDMHVGILCWCDNIVKMVDNCDALMPLTALGKVRASWATNSSWYTIVLVHSCPWMVWSRVPS